MDHGQRVRGQLRRSDHARVSMSTVAIYNSRKNRGMCPYCGARPPIPGFTRCEVCAARNRRGASRYVASNRAKVAKAWRDKYYELKNAGKCTKCRVDMNGEPGIRCTNCMEKHSHPGSTAGFCKGESKALLRSVSLKTRRVKLKRGSRKIDYETNKPTSSNELQSVSVLVHPLG
jgi:hypothetical protein